MGFFYTSLPLWAVISSWLSAAGLLALALSRHPFGRLRNATLQHVWLALVTAMTVLWASNAWLNDGLVMHLLGATLFVTLFDWTLALVAMAAMTGAAAIIFDSAWPSVGLTFLVYGALPVGISTLLQRISIARLPHNLPMFILSQGFISPLIATAGTALTAAGVQIVLASGETRIVPTDYLLYILLLSLGEVWFTSMATTLIALYKPTWVTTLDVRRYRLGDPRL